jgi:hypothetical protein
VLCDAAAALETIAALQSHCKDVVSCSDDDNDKTWIYALVGATVGCVLLLISNIVIIVACHAKTSKGEERLVYQTSFCILSNALRKLRSTSSLMDVFSCT